MAYAFEQSAFTVPNSIIELSIDDIDEVFGGGSLGEAILLGAGAGAFVGSLAGNAPGAAIGALVGGAAGALLYYA